MISRMRFGFMAIAALSFLPFSVGPLTVVTPAIADTDDDGGDDGGGGAGGGGSLNQGGGSGGYRNLKTHKRGYRSSKRTYTKTQRKPPVKIARGLPLAAPDQLVIRSLASAEVSLLESKGFKLLNRFLAKNGTVTAQFKIPPRTSLRRARDNARKLLPTADVDFNHYFRNGFRAQSGGRSQGLANTSYELVGWKANIASCNIDPEIGVIDTWVDDGHPALNKVKIDRVVVEGFSLTAKGSGHGTAVAALIVGNPDGPVQGLLPKARIAAANVFETSGRGDERTDAYLLSAAISEFEKRGTRIVNMSLAGPANDILQKTIEDASTNGMIIIAASGNAGPGSKPVYPAAYEEVIAVTAVSDKLAVYRRAGRGKHIDLAAPGVQIKTAGRNNKTEIFSGSSFAVPFVTAAIAVNMTKDLMKAKDKIETDLKNTARDLGAPGFDPIFGAGLLQFSQDCRQ